ncbi:hypothetical protein LCGC14_0259000 [marine sediment metagenome]|uniref:Uncharacterized protein n=1 Tax=marine sediment metagenome TaxID=412755 RepID=A0A0F9U2H6_9ZZZZ
MSRISLTEACAAALDEARWVTRARRPTDLLAAALDGDEAALAAIAKGWPADTAGARTQFLWVRPAVLQRLAALAYGAKDKPAKGPQAPALLGIAEMIRVFRAS